MSCGLAQHRNYRGGKVPLSAISLLYLYCHDTSFSLASLVVVQRDVFAGPGAGELVGSDEGDVFAGVDEDGKV